MAGPRYSAQEARDAVAASRSYSETLRRLGMCPAGGSHAVLKKWLVIWEIPTDHFDPYATSRELGSRRTRTPLADLLREGSNYHRGHLKRRLFEEEYKERACESCGQGEVWRGRPMALILDHINGIRNDNRLENLRILCPNCAATLDTHCGRKNRLAPRRCLRCDREFQPADGRQRYCSRECGIRWDRAPLRVPRPETRKVERPSHEQLKADLARMSYLAVGRKYGVSDNAIRKWLRWYEAEERREAA
jgi:HNH endonuclease